ncbi:endonuclease [Promineifilum sp.]|uniref:endonuclease n=1 Tax=Promineifilum sp. TaxID=2664178 RepID=UPI0035B44062
MSEQKLNRYTRIIEAIFLQYYREGMEEVTFSRIDIETAAEQLGINLPKNIGDILYSFRYRAALPSSIVSTAQPGRQWIIRATGRATYAFALVKQITIEPNLSLVETKILDATPGVVKRYALSDEQSLLAKLRYNRLIDVFTGLTCYSLQNHLRTTVLGVGQVETDELYIGLDRRGVHYMVPVQAKGAKDQVGQIQIEQDLALCRERFPELLCIPMVAKFIRTDLIALFAFENTEDGIAITSERHYHLVDAGNLSSEELLTYQTRPL